MKPGSMTLLVVSTLVTAAITAAGTPAYAEFPDRSIKLVVPFAAGGPTDALARNLAEGLRLQLKQTVVVENKGGAGANIGAEYAANSPADGYTLLFGTSGPLAINVSLYKKLTYDPIKSFDPVIMIGKLPNVLSAHPSLPVKTVDELIAYAKAGNKLSYSSSGIGASTHLSGILFNSMTGVDLQHIPYRGAAPAMTDLLGGQVPLSFSDVFTSAPQIKAGKIIPLGVTTLERTSILPDVPTFDELGLKGFDVSVFFGIVVPKGTPPEAIKKLNTAFREAIKAPNIKAALDNQGIVPAQSFAPEYLTEFMTAEIPRWRGVLGKVGIEQQ
jgi:tripartite-type tricarboxylate transporter receptor subunit TctC